MQFWKMRQMTGCSLLDHDTHLWVSDQQPARRRRERKQLINIIQGG